jgi:pimeloyl-ACP methyl ester carboxylesterase
LLLAAACVPASVAADVLLHPARRPVTKQPAVPFEAVEFDGAGVKLAGWWFHAARRRGTVVFLHGTTDNRAAGIGVAEHFFAHGYDVIAYDSRAHGESGGDMCTYGFHEKQDLRRVLDRVEVRPIVAMGFSMGAAIALQAAADDPRIAAIVSVSAFSDLRTVVHEHAPFFATRRSVDAALKAAEKKAGFRADDVSPMAAAARIRVPTLVIHGEHDEETPPDHGRRIFAALPGPKRLILVPNGGHSYIVDAAVWRDIDDWLDAALAGWSPTETPPDQEGAKRAPKREERVPNQVGAGHAPG